MDKLATIPSAGAAMVSTTQGAQSIQQIVPRKPTIEIIERIEDEVRIMEYDDLFDKTGTQNVIYKKPVGSGEYAEGLGIRAAELIRSIYGRIAVNSRIEKIDEDNIAVYATATDLVEQNSEEVVFIQHTRYKNGGKYKPDFLQIKLGATAARAKRNAILAVIPPTVKRRLERFLREQMTLALQEKDAERKEAKSAWKMKSVKSFEKYGIDREAIEKRIGKPITEWTDDDRMNLIEIFGGLAEVDNPREAFFGVESVEKTESQARRESLQDDVDDDLFNSGSREPGEEG